MKLKQSSLVCALLATLSLPVSADVAVIVNPANGNTPSEKDINRMFLGKKKSFASGDKVTAIYVKEGADIRAEFDDKVLKKSASQLKAYWSKLMFTGKGTMPAEEANSAAVKARVAAEPNAIGYIDGADVDDSVKVIATF